MKYNNYRPNDIDEEEYYDGSFGEFVFCEMCGQVLQFDGFFVEPRDRPESEKQDYLEAGRNNYSNEALANYVIG